MSITIHQEGIDAAIAAQADGFSGAMLSKVELWSQSAKIKDLTLEGVSVIEPGRIYVVAVDSSDAAYECYEMRFYTDTDVLYATAKNGDGSIIQAKSAQSSLILAHTLNLSAAPDTIAASGDLSMFAPPADENKLGTVVYAKENNLEQKTQKKKVISPSWIWKWWDSVGTWNNVKGKPEKYPPSYHFHSYQSYKKMFYIDQQSGSASGDGSISAPFKAWSQINTAIRDYQYVGINMLSDCVLNEDVDIQNKIVRLSLHGNTLTFNSKNAVITNGNIGFNGVGIYTFIGVDGASIHVNGIGNSGHGRVVIPGCSYVSGDPWHYNVGRVAFRLGHPDYPANVHTLSSIYTDWQLGENVVLCAHAAGANSYVSSGQRVVQIHGSVTKPASALLVYAGAVGGFASV